MKILIVCVLGCAAVVLVGAAALSEETADSDQSESSDLEKGDIMCDNGWTKSNGACFKYIPTSTTWAKAERNCLSMGANLASVRSINEYHDIQKMITTATHEYKPAWIGGSNAQEDSIWLWSDGSPFSYSNWCNGEPNNLNGWQHCVQMNFGDNKCWDDIGCQDHRPFVCAKRG